MDRAELERLEKGHEYRFRVFGHVPNGRRLLIEIPGEYIGYNDGLLKIKDKSNNYDSLALVESDVVEAIQV